MKQTIYFNFIYVIESLRSDEVKTGTNIFNDVIRWKVKALEGFDTMLVTINTKAEFIAALGAIGDRASRAT